ncbi:hypothetical protein MTP99_015588 [Tenebrio molitor]|jgi:hypothetical protein|nr:hypothetical protein MTP99_015588 [Tenebrio molitor]
MNDVLSATDVVDVFFGDFVSAGIKINFNIGAFLDIPGHLRGAAAAKFFINYIPAAIERRCAMRLSNYAAKALQSPGNMPPNGYEAITHRTTGQINLGFGELLTIIYKYTAGTVEDVPLIKRSSESVRERASPLQGNGVVI